MVDGNSNPMKNHQIVNKKFIVYEDCQKRRLKMKKMLVPKKMLVLSCRNGGAHETDFCEVLLIFFSNDVFCLHRHGIMSQNVYYTLCTPLEAI